MAHGISALYRVGLATGALARPARGAPGGGMGVYPAGLTTEEKALRKRYARLQEKVREYGTAAIAFTDLVAVG